jgi:AhpD family alkylhydroperoxidase
MTDTLKRICTASVVLIALFTSTNMATAQETSAESVKRAEAEMTAAFGTVPVMMRVYPEHLRAGAWEWFKSTMSPNATVPPKYAQLISLAVASQIPCAYCIYAHTTLAKFFGATDAEIQEAVASAADVRHWSTVLNGADVPLEEFKEEWDGILSHMKQTVGE